MHGSKQILDRRIVWIHSRQLQGQQIIITWKLGNPIAFYVKTKNSRVQIKDASNVLMQLWMTQRIGLPTTCSYLSGLRNLCHCPEPTIEELQAPHSNLLHHQPARRKKIVFNMLPTLQQRDSMPIHIALHNRCKPGRKSISREFTEGITSVVKDVNMQCSLSFLYDNTRPCEFPKHLFYTVAHKKTGKYHSPICRGWTQDIRLNNKI